MAIASGAALVAALLWVHPARAALHHAGLVVEHSSGRLLTQCVGFVEDQISGFQLIQRSGAEYRAQQFGSLGEAICQLDYEPSQIPSNCFGYGPYWQYFHRTSGGWVQSATGANSWMVHDGDMDGWHYASGGGQTPSNISFAAVCPPTTTAAAASATPAASRSTTAAAAPPTASSAAAPPSSTPTPIASPSLEALAPTASASQRADLTATGPTAHPPSSSPIGTWLFLAGATALLLGLAVVNLLRRGP